MAGLGGDASVVAPRFVLAAMAAAAAISVLAELIPGLPAVVLALPILGSVWILSSPSPALLLVFWSGLLYVEELSVPNLEIKLSMLLLVLAAFRAGQPFPTMPSRGGAVGHRESGTVLWTICALLLLTAWMMFSVTWAVEPDRVIDVAKAWIPLVLLFGAIVYHAPDARHLQYISVALMGSALVSILLGVVLPDIMPAARPQEGRLVGGSGDPNFLAAGLPLVMTLALVWLVHRSERWIRLVLGGLLAVYLVGLVLTASRGGMLATAAVFPIIVYFAGKNRGRLLAVALCGVVVAILAVLVLPVGDRLLSAGGGTGREELWAIALVLIADNPIQGIGMDHFPLLAGNHVRDVGQLNQVDLIVNRPHQTHNIYLQVLVELGFVGLFLFAAFIGGSIVCCLRAGRLFAENGHRLAADLTRALLAGIAAMMVAAFFLPFLLDRRFWLLLALGPALERMAIRTRPQATGRAGSSRYAIDG